MYIAHSCGLMAPVFFRVLSIQSESIHRYWTPNLWATAMVSLKVLGKSETSNPRCKLLIFRVVSLRNGAVPRR